ncbi:hypothetical protein [Bradyrhizobium sp. McL0616]|uniref:hypothetical protein n=1 Tax=Bradyrhizobium sp. McL0616 TaxID=3415674 RepID=UPI003CEA67AE
MKTSQNVSGQSNRKASCSRLLSFTHTATLVAFYMVAFWAEIGPVLAQTGSKANGDQFITVTGQLLLLLGALLTGGGLRYFLEPRLQRRRLRRVMATGLWLSCYELRSHLEAIKTTLARGGDTAFEMRKSLTKIPSYDVEDNPDWFVKTGYFCMITAYKIAAFSAWMKIYQTAVLRALLVAKGNKFISYLFQNFDDYKVAASNATPLWYNYIDSIGEWMIVTEGDLASPIGFGQFCSKYKNDREFLIFFDQLKMFVHFLGRPEEEFAPKYEKVMTQMIAALKSLEKFLGDTRENLLTEYRPKERNIIEGGDDLDKAVKRTG